jgi:phosphate starvation-inducible protein PhoH
VEKIIKLGTHQEAQALFGPHDDNLRAIEKEFKVRILCRGEHLKIGGTASNIKKAGSLIEYILEAVRSGETELGRKDLSYLV